MRAFKLIGAVIAVLAFSALSVATASAAEKLWKFLPGSAGETFTGKTGSDRFFTKNGTINCNKSVISLANASLLEEGTSEKKDATLALAIIDFEECTTAGLPTNSVGDPAKTILAHVEIHTCVVKAGHFGLLIKLLQLHLEIPAAKLLVLLRGDVLALLEGKEGTKVFTFPLNIKTMEKKQELLKCEGGELELLEAADDSEIFEPAAEETLEGSLTFDGTTDANGEEPMV